MKIVKVSLPDQDDLGLKRVEMERLSTVVLLAGPNGAGKTRLLQKLHGWYTANLGAPITNLGIFLSAFWGVDGHQAKFGHLASNGWWRDEDAWKANLLQYGETQRGDIERMRGKLSELEFDPDRRTNAQNPPIVYFVPKVVALDDPAGHSNAELEIRSTAVSSLGVARLESNALPYIQRLQNRWWSASHQESTADAEQRQKAVARYQQLKIIIKRFLDSDLDRDLDGNATIFGLRIGAANLSDGQKILLQLCAAIHAQTDGLSDSIVFLDEPENHLHPSAMLEMVDAIRSAIPNGQLWIATHSVALLAHFDPDKIWWMEDGSLVHAGSVPERVLKGLVGDEEQIARYGDFLALPAVYAANVFVGQCLLPPEVALPQSSDPQADQIRRAIAAQFQKSSVRLLDFGAGRGRLLSCLSLDEGDPEALRGRFDYFAYDRSEKYRAECLAATNAVYKDGAKRCFFNETDLRSEFISNPVDIVVMCNVLHEIEVAQWMDLFREGGVIGSVLRPNGYLLHVEDTELRIGERAHADGFVVLPTMAIRALFCIDKSDADILVDVAPQNKRLVAHLIPAGYLPRINAGSVKNALRTVKEVALAEIRRLRNSPDAATYRKGRQLAFYLVQYANAELALNSDI